MADDGGSSPTFDRYDDEFASLARQVEAALGDGGAGGGSSSQQPSAQHLLAQCDDLLKQMALEARSQDGSLRARLLEKVRRYKGQYQSLRAESDRRGLLLPSGGAEAADALGDQLRRNEDALERQGRTLESARRTLDDTEVVALEIMDELGQNREKLMSAHGRIREVGGLTGRARRVLASMNQRAMQQRLIMYGVGVGLVLAFIALLYGLWS